MPTAYGRWAPPHRQRYDATTAALRDVLRSHAQPANVVVFSGMRNGMQLSPWARPMFLVPRGRSYGRVRASVA